MLTASDFSLAIAIFPTSKVISLQPIDRWGYFRLLFMALIDVDADDIMHDRVSGVISGGARVFAARGKRLCCGPSSQIGTKKPSLPLEVGPLKSSYRGLGERFKLPRRGLGGAPAKIEFGAF